MPIVRLETGELRDEIRQPIYDAQDLLPANSGANFQPYDFFTVVQGKSLDQTNLQQPGQLQTAVSFRIQGLALDAQNINLANAGVLPVLLDYSSLELVVGEKTYWKGPARFAAGRITQNAAVAVGATSLSVLIQEYGWPAVQSVIYGAKHTVDINPLQNFRMQWRLGTLNATEITQSTVAAGTRVRFQASLKGLQRRPVQ